LPNPSYVQPSPHCGPLPGASRERLERKASPNSPCGRQPSAIEA
jgi:hypothetical protein